MCFGLIRSTRAEWAAPACAMQIAAESAPTNREIVNP